MKVPESSSRLPRGKRGLATCYVIALAASIRVRAEARCRGKHALRGCPLHGAFRRAYCTAPIHRGKADCEKLHLVAGLITPITSAEEIAEVEAAARPPGKFEAAGIHMARAREMLSDRDNPDYRNSVKESISAVEAVVRVLTGKPNITLGAGLKTLRQDSVHPALKKAWLEMYGWTSNESGIRHSLTTSADTGLALARYMLVACSAFVNYLIARSDAT